MRRCYGDETKTYQTYCDYILNIVGPKTQKSLQTLNLSENLPPSNYPLLLSNHRDEATAWIAPIHNFFLGLVRAATPAHELLQFKSNWSSVLRNLLQQKQASLQWSKTWSTHSDSFKHLGYLWGARSDVGSLFALCPPPLPLPPMRSLANECTNVLTGAINFHTTLER